MKSSHFHCSSARALAAAIVCAMCATAGAQTPDPAADPAAKPADQPADQPDAGMMARCRQMKERQDRMMAQVKAQDAKLNQLVAAMNSAAPDQKVNAIAALVTQMVEQRVAMHGKMEQLRDEKMHHMMEHMGKGKMQCPADNKPAEPPKPE